MAAQDGMVPNAVPRALGRLRVALDDAYARASREVGLTTQQAELLCAAMRPTAVGDLAQVLRCDRSNVSRLVDRAAARGLLHRRVGELDGRVSVVHLTDAGDQLARRFIAVLAGQLGGVHDRWSTQLQRAAVKAMNEISEALEDSRPIPADPQHD